MTICRLSIVGLTSILIIAIYTYDAITQNVSFFTIIQIVLLIWVSWSIGLSVFISDLALRARITVDTKRSCHNINIWMQSVRVVDANGSPCKIKNPITAWALQLCKWYIAVRPGLSHTIAVLAELLFPWHLLSFTLWLLFILSLTTLIIDMSSSGSAATWGFGQLLPTFLILLPFFTLIETYGGTKSL